MAEGGLAICVLITLAFAVFIVWARTGAGQVALRRILGEPAAKPKTNGATSEIKNFLPRNSGKARRFSANRRKAGLQIFGNNGR